MKYRSKVVEIEAMQFKTNNEPGDVNMNEIVEWVIDGRQSGADHNGTDIFIATLEGVMKASVGDWIIKGTEGEFYPCKDSVFQRKYEPVEPQRCKHGVLAVDRCFECDPNIGQVEV